MARAAKFYRDQLKASPKAIDYLKRRGLTGEIAAHFGLGYAPDGWQGLEAVFPDYGAKDLLEVGLVIENDQGRRYDRFRDRIMFPILDQRGNVIGFGGRVIDQGEPKYLNSPETPLFEKGRELYGLSQAAARSASSDSVIVVEGYMDVVASPSTGAECGRNAGYRDHRHPRSKAAASRPTAWFSASTATRPAARPPGARSRSAWRQLADDKHVGFRSCPAAGPGFVHPGARHRSLQRRAAQPHQPQRIHDCANW